MKATLVIEYDEVLVSPQFMAEHVLELEGVESVGVHEGEMFEPPF